MSVWSIVGEEERNPKISPCSPGNRRRRLIQKRAKISPPPNRRPAWWLCSLLPPNGILQIGEESFCQNQRKGASQKSRARRSWVWERTHRGWKWKGRSVGSRSDWVKWLKAARIVLKLGRRSKRDNLICKIDGDCLDKGRKKVLQYPCWRIRPPSLTEGDWSIISERRVCLVLQEAMVKGEKERAIIPYALFWVLGVPWCCVIWKGGRLGVRMVIVLKGALNSERAKGGRRGLSSPTSLAKVVFIWIKPFAVIKTSGMRCWPKLRVRG